MNILINESYCNNIKSTYALYGWVKPFENPANKNFKYTKKQWPGTLTDTHYEQQRIKSKLKCTYNFNSIFKSNCYEMWIARVI